MQKNKLTTILFALVILIYEIIGQVFLFDKCYGIYMYILNPLAWIGFAYLLKLLVGKQYGKCRVKHTARIYACIAVLAYIIINLISGLVVTFGKNPYSITLFGILKNFLMFGIVIVMQEIVRYKIINNVYEKDKKKIAIIISIIYIIIGIGINNVLNIKSFYDFMVEIVFKELIPIITVNILASYMAINFEYITSIIYILGINMFYWLSPILPNSPWIMNTIIELVIPVILVLYIRYELSKVDKHRSKEKIKNSEPGQLISLTICIVLAIWFALGIFPIKPIAVATGSMEEELSIGDIAFVKKCTANDISKNDIIEYQMDGYTVIHRVIEIDQKDGRFTYITKGDSNNAEDKDPVLEEQLIGKVIFKIKYLGYPAIILHNLQVQNEQKVEVETGNNK